MLMKIFTKIPKKNYKNTALVFVQTMLMFFLMAQFSANFRKKMPVDWQFPSVIIALIILFFCLRYTLYFRNDDFENDETE